MDFVKVWTTYQKWSCLSILVQEGGKLVCKSILSKMGVRYIEDGEKLFQYLILYEDKIMKMGIYHREIILPDNKVIDTSKLDVSLLTYIIEMLDKGEDYTLIKELRDMWYKLLHMSQTKMDMTVEQFEKFWDKISKLLGYLGYDINLHNNLRNGDELDEAHTETLEYILHYRKGRVEINLTINLENEKN